VRITATRLAGKPSGVPTRRLKEYTAICRLTTPIVGNSLIGSARIQFKVAKAWLASNGLQASQIALYRFTTGWDMLDTTMISQDSEYYYFEADSPGLRTLR